MNFIESLIYKNIHELNIEKAYELAEAQEINIDDYCKEYFNLDWFKKYIYHPLNGYTVKDKLIDLINRAELNLSNNLLTEIPSEIGRLTNIESLDLENNLLTEIPSEIGLLVNLKQLDLESNLLNQETKEYLQTLNIRYYI